MNHDIIIFLISLPEPASRGWGEAAEAGHHEPGPAGRGRGQGGQGGGEGGGEAAPPGVAPPGARVPLRPLPQALLLPPLQGEPQTLLLLATLDRNHNII